VRHTTGWKTLAVAPAAPSSCWPAEGSGSGKAQGPTVLKVNDWSYSPPTWRRTSGRVATRPRELQPSLRARRPEAVLERWPAGTLDAGAEKRKLGDQPRCRSGREPAARADDPGSGPGGDRRQGQGGRQDVQDTSRRIRTSFRRYGPPPPHPGPDRGGAKEIQARLAKNESFEELAKNSPATRTAPQGRRSRIPGRSNATDFARAAFA